MKYLSASAFILLLFLTSCKKEMDLNETYIRCGNFESVDCFNQNWLTPLNSNISIVGNGNNGSRCLQMGTDSLMGGRKVYTYLTGLDLRRVYRLTLYAKYKSSSLPGPNEGSGHYIDAFFYPQISSFTIFRQTENHLPFSSDWAKHTFLFSTINKSALRFFISVANVDSAWIDDIQIEKF